ncbi:hypothetical protein [Marinobacter fuscus]|uniref:hypothetical protein n=1 Tax=Marinobacter fuscus TaxID=2109942 RepID=UPI0013FDCA78|nr:hypothetical protein [Marinobacter fuscus]
MIIAVGVERNRFMISDAPLAGWAGMNEAVARCRVPGLTQNKMVLTLVSDE